MLPLFRLAAAGGVLLSLPACADEAPAAPEVVVGQPAPVEDSAVAAPATGRAAETDARAPVAPPVAPPPGPVSSAPAASAAALPRPVPAAERVRVQTVAVTATASGFEPARVVLDPGVPARIVFTRTSETSCATQVVFPSLGIGPVELPLGEPVTVDVPANGPGEIAFACGMDMLRGTLVVGA